MPINTESPNKWYVLALVTVTMALSVAMPRMSMPVLFEEISEDLGLSLVQIGTVWGMMGLGSMIMPLMGGLLVDRLDVRRILIVACILAGLAGALRGLSGGFIGLAASMFLFAFFSMIIPVAVLKIISICFSRRRLGFANGVISVGMGIGFALGGMISATILSPLFGGWRNVLVIYGVISVAISLLWFLTVKRITSTEPSVDYPSTIPLRESISRVVRIRGIWLLGLGLLGYMGSIEGANGYIPIYLREIGWAPSSADSVFAAFNLIGAVTSIPIVLLSDRLGLRKMFLIVASLITAVTIGLLSISDGIIVWVLLMTVGLFRGGFMAILLTMTMELEEVRAAYVATSIGVVLTFSRLGSFISPPLGNSLTNVNLGLPFVFWAALAAMATVVFYFVKETGRRIR